MSGVGGGLAMGMTRVLKVVSFALGSVFVCVGAAFWIRPASASALLGMPLLSDTALSSQIGDLGSFFLVLGASIIAGVFLSSRVWLYCAVMLLGFAVVGRFMAWAFHGAPLTYGLIATEVLAILLLSITAQRLPKSRF
jgi:hypothetical protein